MDVNASYPLVCLSPEQGALVPVATTHVVDADAPDDAEADFRARWWRCFGKLVWLLWLAWNVLRQVRKQVVELRQQAHLDNNRAERCQRGPVLGRKNFYGSGSLWSGRLAAMLFSLFQTVEMWGLDVARWLTHYLSACAKAHGQPPPEPHRYLPWNMTAQEREDLSLAKVPPPSPNATTAA